MREALHRISKALYQPIAPELKYSQTQFEERLAALVARASSWLDLGCGHQLLPEWRADAERTLVAQCPVVVGLDYDLPSLARHRSMRLRVRGDASALPFADASFDLVSANMVVEHLSDPVGQFREVRRVLRPGGTFIFHTPNARSWVATIASKLPDPVKRLLARTLEGRQAEDVFPTHYLANDEPSIRAAAERSGLEVVSVDFVVSTPTFAVVPVLSMAEAVVLRRMARRPELAHQRTNIFGTLRRPA